MTDQSSQNLDVITLAVKIVSAYVSNNTVAKDDIGDFIHNVYNSLAMLQQNTDPVILPLQPAVPIEESITDDYLICLEDGKKLKMLKRHLKAMYGMTPEDYRHKWALPSSYPMVAPSYASRRRTLAKEIGLGKKPKK